MSFSFTKVPLVFLMPFEILTSGLHFYFISVNPLLFALIIMLKYLVVLNTKDFSIMINAICCTNDDS